MKNNNVLYWIVTGIFSAFMLSTSVPDILLIPDAIKFITHLGYPLYFVVFIGIAKTLGSIAILIPGFPRIKEWAYAGLAFDLIAAVYSQIAVDHFQLGILFMLLPLSFEALSYYLYHKKLKNSNN